MIIKRRMEESVQPCSAYHLVAPAMLQDDKGMLSITFHIPRYMDL